MVVGYHDVRRGYVLTARAKGQLLNPHSLQSMESSAAKSGPPPSYVFLHRPWDLALWANGRRPRPAAREPLFDVMKEINSFLDIGKVATQVDEGFDWRTRLPGISSCISSGMAMVGFFPDVACESGEHRRPSRTSSEDSSPVATITRRPLGQHECRG